MQNATNADLRPNAITYNTVMTAFARHGNVAKVQQIFQELKHEFESGKQHCRPTQTPYNILLNAWAKAKDPKQTTNVFVEMLREYEAGRLKEAPGTRDFNQVLNAWAVSNNKKAPKMENNERKAIQGLKF